MAKSARPIRVDSVSALLQAVHEVLRSWGIDESESDIWFRGVSKRSHQLVPGLYRKVNHGLSEDNLLHRFQVKAAGLLSQRPVGEWEWYFLAQHNALPTRLLDWTENLFTATHFALSSKCGQIPFSSILKRADRPKCTPRERADPPVVWMLDANHLNKVSMNLHAVVVPKEGGHTKMWRPNGVSRNRPRKASARGKVISNNRPIAILPPRNSARIAAQDGVFTLHGAGAKPLDDYYGSAKGERLACIQIDPSATASMWRDLLLCGIDRFAVFPEMPALAESICQSLR